MAARQDVRQLLLQVDASVAAAQRGIGQLASQVERDSGRMDRSLATVDGATTRLSAGFSRITTTLGALGLALGAGTIIGAGRNILQMADDLDSAAARAGVGVERFQTLSEAFRALEVEGQTVDRMFQRLLSTLGQVQNGVENGATRTLDRLGIRARILSGEIRDPAQLLDALAAASQRSGSQAQFAADMAEIFGRRLSGQLVPALRDGGEQLHQLEERMRSAGTVIDREMVERLAAANERLDAFTTRMQRTLTIWAGELIRFWDAFGSGAERGAGRAEQALAGIVPPRWLMALLSGGNPAVAAMNLAGQRMLAGSDGAATTSGGLRREFDASSLPRQVEMLRAQAERYRRERDATPRYLNAYQNAMTGQWQRRTGPAYDHIQGLAANPEWARLNARYERALQMAIGRANQTLSHNERSFAGRTAPPSGGDDDDADLRAGASRRGSSGGETIDLDMPANGPITSGFGRRRAPTAGASSNHMGIDIAVPVGTPIRAPADGVIIRTGRNGGYGNVVWIDHGNGTISELNHLSAAIAGQGDRVNRGDVVALSGNTGVSTGPHLDWKVRVGADANGRGGTFVDPRRRRFPGGGMPRVSGPAWESAEEIRARLSNEGLTELEGLFALSPEQIAGIATVSDELAAIAALELPALGDMLPPEDQERLDNFIQDFQRDLAGGLADAIVRGEDLGDTLVRSLQRAASALIESGLMALLTGQPIGSTLIGNLFGGGRVPKIAPEVLAISEGLKFGGGRASGGEVSPGKWYMVGEAGREAFVPKAPGVIIPNHALGRGGGGNVVVHLDYDREVLRAEIVRTSGAVVVAREPAIISKSAGAVFKELGRSRL